MITAIIFDCFGVFYIDPFRRFIANAAPEVRAELHDIMLKNDLGEVEKSQIITRYAELTGTDPQSVESQLYGALQVRDEKLLAYSQELHKRYKVALLSNMSPGVLDNYFTRAEREEFFDTVVVSSEVGLVKPWPDIYKLTLGRLGVTPQEAVFIDDTPVNCEAAQAVGMQAIRYTELPQLQAALAPLLEAPRA